MTGEGEEYIFSARYACTQWLRLSNWNPPFFNNPAGACPTCDGLGVRQFFDAEKVIQSPKQLASGAITTAARVLFPDVTSVAEHYGVDLETPRKSCRKTSSRPCCMVPG